MVIAISLSPSAFIDWNYSVRKMCSSSHILFTSSIIYLYQYEVIAIYFIFGVHNQILSLFTFVAKIVLSLTINSSFRLVPFDMLPSLPRPQI